MATEFIVNDMTCNHCVQTITKAIQSIEPQAVVAINLAEHRVSIEHAKNPQALAEIIREEGYEPELA